MIDAQAAIDIGLALMGLAGVTGIGALLAIAMGGSHHRERYTARYLPLDRPRKRED